MSGPAPASLPPPRSLLPSLHLHLHLLSSLHLRPQTPLVLPQSWCAELSLHQTTDKSEADKIIDGMDFRVLCDEFECCISSPLVESTVRQLARDRLKLHEGSRALDTFAVSVKYKDPLRTFIGWDKYERPLWVKGALENPSVVSRNSSIVRSSFSYNPPQDLMSVRSTCS